MYFIFILWRDSFFTRKKTTYRHMNSNGISLILWFSHHLMYGMNKFLSKITCGSNLLFKTTNKTTRGSFIFLPVYSFFVCVLGLKIVSPRNKSMHLDFACLDCVFFGYIYFLNFSSKKTEGLNLLFFPVDEFISFLFSYFY